MNKDQTTISENNNESKLIDEQNSTTELESKQNDCVFCKIIKGEIPSYKIYENEYVYAFLDIADDCLGHTLVVPKKHYENIFETPEEEYLEVLKAVKKIAVHYVNDCGFGGINILNANGKSAQQSVFHLHFHILPRTIDDGLNAWPTLEKQYQNFEAVQRKLQLPKTETDK